MSCDDYYVAPGPHGRPYRRAGHTPLLCAACWHDSLGETDGDRYQAVSISGYPATGTSHSTVWHIQDRYYNHQVIATYFGRGAARDERDCLRETARLNRDERRWMQTG